MKVYDPKTAIANRLQGQVFSINNENDERAMLSEIICAGSGAFKEYVSECDTLKHDEYDKNLDDTAKEAYEIYLDKSQYVLEDASLEYIKNQIKEQSKTQQS